MAIQVSPNGQHILPLRILRFLPKEFQVIAPHIVPLQQGYVLQVDSIAQKAESPYIQGFGMRLIYHLRIEQSFDLLLLEGPLRFTRGRYGITLERILRKAHHPFLHRHIIYGTERAQVNSNGGLGFLLRKHPNLIGGEQIGRDVLKLQIPAKQRDGVKGRLIGFGGLDPLLGTELQYVLLKKRMHLLHREFRTGGFIGFTEFSCEDIKIEMFHSVNNTFLLTQPFIDPVFGILELLVAQVGSLHLFIVLFR